MAVARGLSDLHRLARFECVQNSYSLLDRSAEREVLPLCADQHIGFTAFSPLAGGWLTGKYRRDVEPDGSRMTLRPEPYVAWSQSGCFTISPWPRRRGRAASRSWRSRWQVLRHPQVDGAIIGPRSPTLDARARGLSTSLAPARPPRSQRCWSLAERWRPMAPSGTCSAPSRSPARAAPRSTCRAASRPVEHTAQVVLVACAVALSVAKAARSVGCSSEVNFMSQRASWTRSGVAVAPELRVAAAARSVAAQVVAGGDRARRQAAPHQGPRWPDIVGGELDDRVAAGTGAKIKLFPVAQAPAQSGGGRTAAGRERHPVRARIVDLSDAGIRPADSRAARVLDRGFVCAPGLRHPGASTARATGARTSRDRSTPTSPAAPTISPRPPAIMKETRATRSDSTASRRAGFAPRSTPSATRGRTSGAAQTRRARSSGPAGSGTLTERRRSSRSSAPATAARSNRDFTMRSIACRDQHPGAPRIRRPSSRRTTRCRCRAAVCSAPTGTCVDMCANLPVVDSSSTPDAHPARPVRWHLHLRGSTRGSSPSCPPSRQAIHGHAGAHSSTRARGTGPSSITCSTRTSASRR